MPRRTFRHGFHAFLKRSIRVVSLLALVFFLGGVYFSIQREDSSVMDLSDSFDKSLHPSLTSDGGKDAQSPKILDGESDAELDFLSLKRSDNDPMGNPIVLWWTPFTGEIGSNRNCGVGSCFFTQDRLLKHSIERTPTKPVAYVFYGSDFRSFDLPLPRYEHEEWALFHEESPKNNYLFSHKEPMSLFNFTATFKNASDFPLTTQYIESLETITSKKFYQSTARKNELRRVRGFSPIMYVQSSCEAPSERDTYVAELMKYIDVDSYGRCLHNKDLPPHIAEPVEGMNHDDFLSLVGNYKFVLAMENANCDEYMTEKLWRTIFVGAVPVYYGSSKSSTSSWLPNGPESAIFISDFLDPSNLASELLRLDADDHAYESFLQHKLSGRVANSGLKKALTDRKWGVSIDDVIEKGSFVSSFECFLCDQLHAGLEGNRTRKVEDKSLHYDCPEPKPFPIKIRNKSRSDHEESSVKMWRDSYWIAKYEGQAMRELMQTHEQISQDQIMELAMELYSSPGRT